MYRIGQLAKILNISPETIRVWEKRRLIPQAHRKSKRGFRYWTEAEALIIIDFPHKRALENLKELRL